MSLVIKSTAATFTKHLGSVAYPVSRGLVGLYFFGSNRANQLLNGVQGGARLTQIGSPTTNPNTVTVDHLNGFDTGLPDAASQTFIAVSRFAAMAGGNGFPMVGNLNQIGADTDIGTMLAQLTGFSNLGVGVATNTQTQCYRSNNVLTGLNIVAGDAFLMGGVVDTSGPWGRVYTSYRGSAGYDQTAIGTRSLDTEYTIKIGAHGGTYAPYNQSGEIYAAAIHNVALTNAEMVQVMDWLRAQYRALGITTL